MRRLIAFACAQETLLGTLDEAPGATGLLIVSGGNEIRAGAHRGMAQLAARLAAAGIPVFRFDRRGIGDSTGDNLGYTESGEDIAAAAAAFRAAIPQLTQIVGFGNCDAATALALFHGDAGIDRLVLANPWIVQDKPDDALPPAAAIRERYRARLADPRQWLRLIRGQVDIGNLAKGIAKVMASSPPASGSLADRVASAIEGSPTTVLLAKGDATAIAFTDAMRQTKLNIELLALDTQSHSFAREVDQQWLLARLVERLEPRR